MAWKFKCPSCGTTLTESAAPGQLVVCHNCNTRQLVPAGAEDTNALPPASPPSISASRPSDPSDYFRSAPNYFPVLIAGYLIMLFGVLTIISAPFVQMNAAPNTTIPPLFVVAALGIIEIGFGQMLHCIRDIAQNSFGRP